MLTILLLQKGLQSTEIGEKEVNYKEEIIVKLTRVHANIKFFYRARRVR